MCRVGGRRCPACDEPSTANRHNLSRRAKTQGLTVATLAAEAAAAQVGILEAVENAEPAAAGPAARPKSLREMLAQKQALVEAANAARSRRREAAVANTAWSRHGFQAPHEPRRAISGSEAAQMDARMEQVSKEWASRLEADELDALSDYSLGASGELNKRLKTNGEMGPGAQQLIAHLDSAFGKAGLSPEPVLVYRGASCPHGLVAEEWAEVDFPIGAEVNFPTYLSTTSDAAIAASFSTRQESERSVMFEIKTRQGAPMAAVSSYGNGEREHLMPRDTAARVVGVQYDVPFQVETDGITRTITKTVIQVVEISALD